MNVDEKVQNQPATGESAQDAPDGTKAAGDEPRPDEHAQSQSPEGTQQTSGTAASPSESGSATPSPPEDPAPTPEAGTPTRDESTPSEPQQNEQAQSAAGTSEPSETGEPPADTGEGGLTPNQTPAPAAESGPSGDRTPASEPASPEEQPKRRVRLNPTMGSTQAKPVANVADAPTPPAEKGETKTAESTTAAASAGSEEQAPAARAEEDSGEESEASDGAAPAPAAPAAPPPGRVEVPRTAELDEDLEAQIAAALSGEQSAAEQAEKTAAAEAAAAESDEESGEESEAPAAPVSEDELSPGDRLNVKISSIHGDDVFLDLGLRSTGITPKRQFDPKRPPAVGQLIQVVVDKVDSEEGLIHCSLPKGTRRIAGNWEALSKGQVVECMVDSTNKGGLQVSIGGIRGFLPASQVDLHFTDDLEQFVGQKVRAEVTEVNRKKRNLVVSRRKVLQAERQEAEQAMWQQLEKGQQYTGTVKTIKDYGAFVDIGGVDGFLHVGDISWNRIKHPSDVIQQGQQVDVQVVKLDPEKKRIGLSMKQLVQNPWADVESKYPQSSTVHGRVTRTADFGAFVELEPGVEGLIHISELDHSRVRRVTDVVQEGQEVDARVLDVDPGRKRISLSLKALKDAPAPPSDEDLSPGSGEAYTRKRKGPLKGGTGESAGGGLFGNPDDFE